MSNFTPLYNFFSARLRADRAGHHEALSPEGYLALLEALSRGIGLSSPEALYALCKALFLKPHHLSNGYAEAELAFRRDFEASLSRVVTAAVPAPAALPPPPAPETSPQAGRSGAVSTPPTDKPETRPEAGGSALGNSLAHHQRVGLRFGAAEAGAQPFTPPDWEAQALGRPFRFDGRYVPIDGRTLRQHLRGLRLPDPRPGPVLDDLDATLDRVARRGFFDEVVRQNTVQSRQPLTLLLDRQGSMRAFHALGDELALATRQQATEEAAVYYFHNCPLRCLFATPDLTQPLLLPDWQRRHPDARVLILSDAGAARNEFSDERLSQVQKFLYVLRPRRVAWLNPLPRLRWPGNLAEALARLVPMFPADNAGLSQAFRWLRQG